MIALYYTAPSWQLAALAYSLFSSGEFPETEIHLRRSVMGMLAMTSSACTPYRADAGSVLGVQAAASLVPSLVSFIAVTVLTYVEITIWGSSHYELACTTYEWEQRIALTRLHETVFLCVWEEPFLVICFNSRKSAVY
jgi:hypothetical protein